MNLQRIACDILGIEDAAFTLKQTGYLEETIKLLPGIEQRALENDKFSGYGAEESSLYARAIQNLKEDKLLYSILALSTLDYSVIIGIVIDFMTGEIADGEELEIEGVEEIPASDNDSEEEALSSDEGKTHKYPKYIEDFLNAKVCIFMPTFDHDCGRYIDDDCCPLDTAYTELWKTQEKKQCGSKMQLLLLISLKPATKQLARSLQIKNFSRSSPKELPTLKSRSKPRPKKQLRNTSDSGSPIGSSIASTVSICRKVLSSPALNSGAFSCILESNLL